jgi:hypothetical protein
MCNADYVCTEMKHRKGAGQAGSFQHQSHTPQGLRRIGLWAALIACVGPCKCLLLLAHVAYVINRVSWAAVMTHVCWLVWSCMWLQVSVFMHVCFMHVCMWMLVFRPLSVGRGVCCMPANVVLCEAHAGWLCAYHSSI